MSEETSIGWTDATMNFWIGCGEVGPGCDGCYARALVTTRLKSACGDVWGLDKPRYRTMEKNWKKPISWNAYRALGFDTTQSRGRTVKVPLWVFALSLGDFFDKNAETSWRDEAWDVIRRTPFLRWQLVTKRLSNVVKMLPADWNHGIGYEHVGIIASVVTQKEYERDFSRLLDVKEKGIRWVGLSIEPQIEEIDLTIFAYASVLDWVIGGGESTQTHHAARPYHLEWGLSLAVQCRAIGVPYFEKQIGSNAYLKGERFTTSQRAGTEPGEWPPELRVQQMPRIYDQQGASDGEREQVGA